MSGSQSRRREEDELSLDRIRQFAELMKEHGLSQLELSEKGRRIRLCRGNVLEMAPAVVSPASAFEIARRFRKEWCPWHGYIL